MKVTKHIFLFLYLFTHLSGTRSLAQSDHSAEANKKADSLAVILRNAKKDSEKNRVMLDMANLYYDSEPDKARSLSNKVIDISQRGLKGLSSSSTGYLALKRNLEEAYNMISYINLNAGDHERALEFSFKDLKELKEICNISSAREDKVLLGACLFGIGTVYKKKGDPSLAKSYFMKALKLHTDLQDHSNAGNVAENLSAIFLQTGKTDSVLYYMKLANELFQLSGDKQKLISNYSNIGEIYRKFGNISGSLEYSMKALSLVEQNVDKNGVVIDRGQQARSLMNVAYLLREQHENIQSNAYYRKAMKIQKEIGDLKGLASSYNNFGLTHKINGSLDSARYYYLLALEIQENMKDKDGISTTLSNIGVVYKNMGDFESAKNFYLRAIKIQEEIKDVESEAKTLAVMASLEMKLSSIAKNRSVSVSHLHSALNYATMSKACSDLVNLPEAIRNSAERLYQVNKLLERPEPALKYFELYIKMRDSINNESTRKASIRSQLKYEYEKQAAADSVAHAKESEIKNAELKRQEAEIKAKKNQQYALFGGLFCVCVFGVFMFNRFKVTQKQKNIIELQKYEVEEQKKLVEEKQKEILDSIHYARKIQMALIPSEKRFGQDLKRLGKN